MVTKGNTDWYKGRIGVEPIDVTLLLRLIARELDLGCIQVGRTVLSIY